MLGLKRHFASFRVHLKSFTVHLKQHDPRAYEHPQFVEEGFSWWAFLFAPLWALYHRLWWTALGLIVFDIALKVSVKKSFLALPMVVAIELGLFLIVGFYADELRRAKLVKRGYVLKDIMVAENLAGAQLRFFERAFADRSPSIPLPV